MHYKITKYFDDNNLFDSTDSNGLSISIDSDVLLIKGHSRDLVEFADILVNIAANKDGNSHVHIDELTILDKNSQIKELIIEKES